MPSARTGPSVPGGPLRIVYFPPEYRNPFVLDSPFGVNVPTTSPLVLMLHGVDSPVLPGTLNAVIWKPCPDALCAPDNARKEAETSSTGNPSRNFGENCLFPANLGSKFIAYLRPNSMDETD